MDEKEKRIILGYDPVALQYEIHQFDQHIAEFKAIAERSVKAGNTAQANKFRKAIKAMKKKKRTYRDYIVMIRRSRDGN